MLNVLWISYEYTKSYESNIRFKAKRNLCLLKTKSLSAGEIASNFDISSAAISRHLSVLQDAQLVEAQRNGKNIIYSLNISLVEEMLIFINNIFSKDNSNI